MSATTPASLRVLSVFAESQIEGRRIVVFGQATSGFAQCLVEAGARLVHVYDTDLGRLAEAASLGLPRHVSYAQLSQAGAAIRDGSFDIGFIEDLALADDANDWLSRLEQALSPRGQAYILSANPEHPSQSADKGSNAIGYYEFYDLLSTRFEEIKMLAQVPFFASAIVDFAAEDDFDFSIDNSLLPSSSEIPEWYLAAVSQRSFDVEPFSIIQLPIAETIGKEKRNSGDNLLRQLRASELQAKERAESLHEENSEYRRQLQLLQARISEAEEVAKIQSALKEQELWAKKLEVRAKNADERASEIEAELARARQQSERFAQVEAQRNRAEEELKTLKAKRSDDGNLAGAVKELKLERDKLQQEVDRLISIQQKLSEKLRNTETQLADLLAQNANLEADAADFDESAELEEFEAQLRDRGLYILELEAEQKRSLARIEKLTAQITPHDDEEAPSELILVKARNRELGQQNSALQAELQLLRWQLLLQEQSGLPPTAPSKSESSPTI